MTRPSDKPDKEDREVLAGKSRNYIIGWNRVKHSGGDKNGKTNRPAVSVGRVKKGKAGDRNPAPQEQDAGT